MYALSDPSLTYIQLCLAPALAPAEATLTYFHEVGLCVEYTGRAAADQIWAAILQVQNLWSSEKTEEPRPPRLPARGVTKVLYPVTDHQDGLPDCSRDPADKVVVPNRNPASRK